MSGLVGNPEDRFSRDGAHFSISELGDKHSQEHPGILSFSVLFFRWHNFLADKFMQEGSEGVDHTFAKTRHWVIASLQVHILNETSKPPLDIFSNISVYI